MASFGTNHGNGFGAWTRAAFAAQPDEEGGGDGEEDKPDYTEDTRDGNVGLGNVPGSNTRGGCTGHRRMVVSER